MDPLSLSRRTLMILHYIYTFLLVIKYDFAKRKEVKSSLCFALDELSFT